MGLCSNFFRRADQAGESLEKAVRIGMGAAAFGGFASSVYYLAAHTDDKCYEDPQWYISFFTLCFISLSCCYYWRGKSTPPAPRSIYEDGAPEDTKPEDTKELLVCNSQSTMSQSPGH